MKTNVLAIAAALSDQDLLARLDLLAGRERESSVDLVAHLAALDTRPSLFAAKGYSSSSPTAPRLFGSLKMPPVTASRRLGHAGVSR